MSLDETKRLLSQKYLGKEGIHGIGLSQRDSAIRVHLAPARDADHAARQDDLLAQLKKDAGPHAVQVTREDAPMKTD
jgi:5,10-methylenetetrahydrofolate reductase